ncbi:hypothetical protein yaldo0001_23030 [Yersinia aldovae ATCC 35236]|nr:hypothetical protein yaldo0001_23030 [Yersinia aldovae ATCC 35236]
MVLLSILSIMVFCQKRFLSLFRWESYSVILKQASKVVAASASQ